MMYTITHMTEAEKQNCLDLIHLYETDPENIDIMFDVACKGFFINDAIHIKFMKRETCHRLKVPPINFTADDYAYVLSAASEKDRRIRMITRMAEITMKGRHNEKNRNA